MTAAEVASRSLAAKRVRSHAHVLGEMEEEEEECLLSEVAAPAAPSSLPPFFPSSLCQ